VRIYRIIERIRAHGDRDDRTLARAVP
jgi:hypothetical protein